MHGAMRLLATGDTNRKYPAIHIVHFPGPRDEGVAAGSGFVECQDRCRFATRKFRENQLSFGSVFPFEFVTYASLIVRVIVATHNIAIGLPDELEHGKSCADVASVLLRRAVGEFLFVDHM